jgi:hypothetical protein
MANCEMYWNILKCKCWPTWRPWESSSTANRMRIFQTPGTQWNSWITNLRPKGSGRKLAGQWGLCTETICGVTVGAWQIV